MSERLGGWARLGVVLGVAWAVGVSLFAAVCWLRLTYGYAPHARPFAYWEMPAAAPRSEPERLMQEWDQAFWPCSVHDPVQRGCRPRFCCTVYLALLTGPLGLALLTVAAARWVQAGFRRVGPVPGDEALLPFAPPGISAPAHAVSGSRPGPLSR
jgi:hypothetical protein